MHDTQLEAREQATSAATLSNHMHDTSLEAREQATSAATLGNHMHDTLTHTISWVDFARPTSSVYAHMAKDLSDRCHNTSSSANCFAERTLPELARDTIEAPHGNLASTLRYGTFISGSGLLFKKVGPRLLDLMLTSPLPAFAFSDTQYSRDGPVATDDRVTHS